MPSTQDQQAPVVGELLLPRAALKALGEVPGLAGGPLSPLARVRAPEAPADRGALIDTLEGLSGAWQTAIPALVDPALTVLLMLAGADTSVIGQFLWPDPADSGPGFRLDARSDDLRLTGPFYLGGVRARIQDALSLETVECNTSIRLTMSAEQFFVLAALVDAYVAAVARRRAARLAGPPPGFSAREIVSTWRSGLERPDPAWSVSLFALLNADALPQDFDGRIPAVLREMAGAGLIAVLYSDSGEPADDMYVPGQELDRLCRLLAAGGTNFGLAVQRRTDAHRVEATILGGWRTSGGIWLVDLSALPGYEVELSVLDPQVFTGLMDEVFGPPPQTGVSSEAPAGLGLESILTKLKSGGGPTPGVTTTEAPPAAIKTPPPPAAVSACPKCGKSSQGGGRFCGNCGAPLTGADSRAPEPSRQQNVCGNCGKALIPGAAFCGHCGTRTSAS